MNETENNTSGGPGNEAKTPHVLDFNGVEIHPDLYAVKADELQRIGNAAYQAGRSERDAEAKRVQAANEALSGRVEQLREALEASHQREMQVAGLLGCAPPDAPRQVRELQGFAKRNGGEVAMLRSALETASQQQACVAAALGSKPGEDVAAKAYAVAGILRKTCDVLRLDHGAAEDLPGAAERLDRVINSAVRRLGFAATTYDGFEKAFAERIDRVRDETETRTRKACADQVNAAQAMIDGATREHEAERSKLLARITEVEKQRDESREAHAKTELRLKDYRDRSNRQWATLCEIGALASQKDNETFPEAVRRVVAEKANAVETLRDCRAKLEEEREAMQVLLSILRTVTLAAREEDTLDAVKRVVAERDEAVGREATRAIPLRTLDVFRDGIKIGDIVCRMPNSTFAVGP